jgi:hypothetical protein
LLTVIAISLDCRPFDCLWWLVLLIIWLKLVSVEISSTYGISVSAGFLQPIRINELLHTGAHAVEVEKRRKALAGRVILLLLAGGAAIVSALRVAITALL